MANWGQSLVEWSLQNISNDADLHPILPMTLICIPYCHFHQTIHHETISQLSMGLFKSGERYRLTWASSKLTWPYWSCELLLPLGVRRPSVVISFYISIFSSETTRPIWTKLGRDCPWVVPFQNCARRPHSPTKMAAVAKNIKFGKKSLKSLLVWNCLVNWNQTFVKWSLDGPLLELSDDPTRQPRRLTSTDIFLTYSRTLWENVFKNLLLWSC